MNRSRKRNLKRSTSGIIRRALLVVGALALIHIIARLFYVVMGFTAFVTLSDTPFDGRTFWNYPGVFWNTSDGPGFTIVESHLTAFLACLLLTGLVFTIYFVIRWIAFKPGATPFLDWRERHS